MTPDPPNPSAKDPSTKNSSARIAEEHRELQQTLRQLEQATETGRIASLLESLHSQLELHFSEEEADDGLAEAIPVSTPHHRRELEHLFDEHRLFISRIGTLSNRLRLIEANIADLHDDMKTLCTDLRRHEARENSLLTEAVFTDVGTGD